MIMSKANEDGIVFVTGPSHQYVVDYDFDGIGISVVEDAAKVFRRMDMADCYPISIERIQLIVDNRTFRECDFWGTWCCKNPETNRIDPLRMEIRTTTGDVLDVGYGTDH